MIIFGNSVGVIRFFHWQTLNRLYNISREDPVTDLVVNLGKHFTGSEWKNNLLRNRNAIMLGLNPEDCENKDKIKDFMQKTSDEFDHMLISEFSDVSLIVMRRKFCWEFSDILYLPLNVKKYSYKKYKSEKDSEVLWGEKVRRWSQVDFQLYRMFNKTLWRDIALYGQSFWQELDFFQVHTKRICAFCSQILNLVLTHSIQARILLQSNEHMTIPGSPWGGEYRIDHVWCLMSKINLNALKNIIRVKLYPKLCDQLSPDDNGGKYLSLNKFQKFRNETLVKINPLFCSKNLTPTFSTYQVPVEILVKRRVYTTGF